MKYKDHKGLVWTRSEDGTRIEADNGAVVIGLPEMSAEYLVSIVYQDDPAFTLTPVSQ